MRHQFTGSLVALHFILLCGGLSAQDTAAVPRAHIVSGRATPAASQAASASRKPVEDLALLLTRRLVTAPGYLRSVIRVAPSDDNRTLRVTIDSEDYFRASEIQLDGASAPMSHFIDWKQMPAGTYELTATLIGPGGTRAERQTSFRVLGPILAQRCC
jgi:hypothetical protein